jgi:hypothetical protein
VALAFPAIEHAAEEARKADWLLRTLPADHGVNFTMPKELSEILLELG